MHLNLNLLLLMCFIYLFIILFVHIFDWLYEKKGNIYRAPGIMRRSGRLMAKMDEVLIIYYRPTCLYLNTAVSTYIIILIPIMIDSLHINPSL